MWGKRSSGGGRRARLWNARRQADQSSAPAADLPRRHRPALLAHAFTPIDGHPRADEDQTGGPAVRRHRGNRGGRAGATAGESVVGRGGGAPPATHQSVAGSACGSGSDAGGCRRQRRVPPSERGQKDAGGAKMDGRWGEASTASTRPSSRPRHENTPPVIGAGLSHCGRRMDGMAARGRRGGSRGRWRDARHRATPPPPPLAGGARLFFLSLSCRPFFSRW